MNSPDGRIKANAAVVPSGNDAVSVYASDTTDVILDIDGYFASSGSQTYQFYTLTPCRLVDTRGADGDLGGPRLVALTRDRQDRAGPKTRIKSTPFHPKEKDQREAGPLPASPWVGLVCRRFHNR